MKKNKHCILWISILVLFLLVLFSWLIYFNVKYIKIDNAQKILDSYNENITTIKDAMDVIATDSEDGLLSWDRFKWSLDDSTLFQPILILIRNYYFQVTGNGTNKIGDGNSYSNSNFLQNFAKKERMSRKEFNSLMDSYKWYNNACLKDFYEYYIGIKGKDEYKLVAKELENLGNYYKKISNQEFKNYEAILKNEEKKSDLVKNLTETLARYMTQM